MVGILVFVGASLGGWLGWWLGSFMGTMGAFVVSVIGSAAGVYFARRYSRNLFG